MSMNAPKLRFKDENGKDYPDWIAKHFGDIGETYGGMTGKNKSDFGHGDAKYVTYMNVYQNPISKSDGVDKTEKDISQHEVKYGDIFFTTSSETPEEVGLSSVWLENSANTYLNSFCFGYRLNRKADLYFLSEYLRSPVLRNKIIFLAQGISRYNISKSKVKKILVNLPCLQEQQKIGIFFTKLDGLIAVQRRKLKSLEQIKKGLLQKIFSQQIRFNDFNGQWKQVYLFDCIRKITDFRGRTPKKLGMDWSKGGHIVLSANNVKDGYIDFSKDVHYGDDSLYKKWMAGNELHKGQVLFTTEAPMGNVAQIPDDKQYILSQRTIAFSVKENILSEGFLTLVLRSPHVKNKLYTLQSGGTAKGVSQKTLSSLKIRIPSNLDEQNKLASLFAKFDELITTQYRKLKLYEQVKKAFLLQMFI